MIPNLLNHRQSALALASEVIKTQLPESQPYPLILWSLLEKWQLTESETLSASDLPFITCLSAGGDPSQVVPVTTVWWLTRLALKILDDVEDKDITELSAESINVSTGFLAAANLALAQLSLFNVNSHLSNTIYTEYSKKLFSACNGQHHDLVAKRRNIILDTDSWLEIAAEKSGAIYAWAAWAGSALAKNNNISMMKAADFGLSLGILAQIADDYEEIRGNKNISSTEILYPSLSLSYTYTLASPNERENIAKQLYLAHDGNINAQFILNNLATSHEARCFMLIAALSYKDRSIYEWEQTGCDSNTIKLLINNMFPEIEYITKGNK